MLNIFSTFTLSQIIRSFIFDIIFYSFTGAYFLCAWPLMLFPGTIHIRKALHLWSRITLVLIKRILGLSYNLVGYEEFLKFTEAGPVIIAAKHLSFWDTISLGFLIPNACFVIKKSLFRVPVYGYFLKRLQAIGLERTKAALSLRKLLKESALCKDRAQNLLLFPEGTRGVYGQPGIYQVGIGAIYSSLNIPVMPIAHNAGKFWPRKSFVKLPGEITIVFLSPILPGLERKQFMQTLALSIEEACEKIAQ